MDSAMEKARGFFGIWHFDLAESDYQFGTPPRSGSYTIEPAAGALSVTMEWETQDGRAFRQTYSGLLDGQSYPIEDTPGVHAFSMTLIDERTLETAASKDGHVINLARRILSEDGQVMLITITGITPGNTPYTNTSIYRKQPARRALR